jgi:undecaprenyl-diphosphatase
MSTLLYAATGQNHWAGFSPWFAQLQEHGFTQVNRFAAATQFLHTPFRAFAQYGEVVFALLLLLNLLLAHLTTRTGDRAADRSMCSARPAALSAAVWAPAGMLLAIAANQPLVKAVHEPRPYTVLPHAHVLVAHSSDYGLPSDHAVMAGAVLAGVLLTQRQVPSESRRRWLTGVTAAAALLMAFARVYVGAHFPLDVVIGLLVGAGVTTLLYLLSRPLLERLVEPVLDHVLPGSRTETSAW